MQLCLVYLCLEKTGLHDGTEAPIPAAGPEHQSDRLPDLAGKAYMEPTKCLE